MSALISEPAYLLHGRPYRETSILAEFFTSTQGRVAILARGARRPKSRQKAALQPFYPVVVSATGRSSLKTLQQIDLCGMAPPLAGACLISGLYLNELLQRLLPEGEPHPRMYTVYEWALTHLSEPGELEPVLRRFEKELLSELGFAVVLDYCVASGEPVLAEAWYAYHPEHGLRPVVADGRGSQRSYPGAALLAMAQDDYSASLTRKVAKVLLREALVPLLGHRPLHSRSLFLPPPVFSS